MPNLTSHIKTCVSTTIFIFASTLLCAAYIAAQDTVTGAFEGIVTNSLTGEAVAGATADIINQQTNLTITKQTDARGRFYQGLLTPGIYLIRVSAAGFQTQEVIQRLFITRTGEVVPVPVTLDPLSTTTPATAPAATISAAQTDVRAKLNFTNASRDGSFTEAEVVSLPLGAQTFTRTFDELALLLPGVALPPQTIGNGTGPGQGAGVGSSGQFAVNGLRSRANNFTVDGSDNNDEDIGVRRQGFFALNSQPIESVREYHVITLLAPAQFGRNLGAQVNAVSRTGGDVTHGTLYGFFNSSQLNARNFFDSNAQAGEMPLLASDGRAVLFNDAPLVVRNGGGGENSFTFAQGGFALGGDLLRRRAFYFIAAEGQLLNAMQEQNFAVPTISERGVFNTGESGFTSNPFTGEPTLAFPSSIDGNAILSLFPFPNNPGGVYGANTYTETLPAGARGGVGSIRVDAPFRFRGREQSITNRYNFTEDTRTLPTTGEAIYSSLRPRTRTQNFSFFLNSELSATQSVRPVFNQLRLSYGRTRLNFDTAPSLYGAQLPSRAFPTTDFLLNAPLYFNTTFNSAPAVTFTDFGLDLTSEDVIGPVGQVIVAGYSPIGVDVFNFPQRRINNTYQLADQVSARFGEHTLVFGADNRRSELASDLPRNARPLITFNGARALVPINEQGDTSPTIGFIRPIDFAAAGASSGLFLTLAAEHAPIMLRSYQLNFFAQDTWRVRRNLSLSYGARYEYNTPVREINRTIERTFNDPALELVPGLRRFVDDRTAIYDADRNNFAPRLGLAYAPDIFAGRPLVLRAGYGIFYDQILGAVASQSRNVFPTYLTVNFAGGLGNIFSGLGMPFGILNPATPHLAEFFATNPSFVPLVQPGTLNRLVPGRLADQLEFINFFSSIGGMTGAGVSTSGIVTTLAARRLPTPLAHHYTASLDVQLNRDTFASIAYVGTTGENLLRFATPNAGANAVLVPLGFTVGEILQPGFVGFALPGFDAADPDPDAGLSRPTPDVGALNVFETTARSRYDSLQLQLRGRFRRGLQYQAAYTLAKAFDDVSDVFDLAGASSLPQNSFRPDERAYANFDVRHRLTYNFIYDLPQITSRDSFKSQLLNDWQIASTGRFSTGQPFTVNSINDVNLDGNLTDRLNTIDGLTVTGNRRQPLRLTVNPNTLLAPFALDGAVGRNTFRAGGIVELDAAITKTFRLTERRSLLFRTEVFNFLNQANFGIPVRFLEAPGFGQATSTVTPARRIQFALKYQF